jgi:hypothetical protein
MIVPVIILVDSEPFVREAPESALAQPETGEVLLIQDTSPHNSQSACRALAKGFHRVELLCHRDRRNSGAGPSRRTIHCIIATCTLSPELQDIGCCSSGPGD